MSEIPNTKHSFKDLDSPRALVCRKEINGDQGGATVWMVLAADGFLFDCGTNPERAVALADLINAGGPEKLSHAALKEGA